MAQPSQQGHASAGPYVAGFIFSLVLTIVPLALVLGKTLRAAPLVVVILAAACLQFLVQVYYFMHLKEAKNRVYILLTLAVGIVITVAVIGGSAWVMKL